MIQDLLKKWSELEPERCRAYQDGLADSDSPAMYVVLMEIRQQADWVEIGSMYHSGSMSGLAILQYALQQAIVAHKIGCILQRSALVDDWEAKVGAFLAWHPETATALLSAYVQWLERSEEVSEP